MSATTLVKAAQPGASGAHTSRRGGQKRTCTCGRPITTAGECAECRKKRLQRKLAIGASNGPLEHEADRVARDVVIPADISSSPIPRRRVQRRNDPLNETEFIAPPSVDRALAEPGQALEPTFQAEMSQRFGYDFSHVRVHVGSAASLSAREINAQAYTVGPDVVFAAGRYSSGTATGRRLLAHELVHVVQQSGARGLTASSSSAEQEAQSLAARITSGAAANVQAGVTRRLQRAEDPESLHSSFDPSNHSYEKLVAEAGRIHRWLENNPANSPQRSALERKLAEIVETANRIGAKLGYPPLSFVDLRPFSKSPEQTQALDKLNKLSQPTSPSSPFFEPPKPKESPPAKKPETTEALPSYIVWGPLFLEGLKEGVRGDARLQAGFETLKAQLAAPQGKLEFGGGIMVGIVPGAGVAVGEIPYSVFKAFVELGLATNFGHLSKEEVDKAIADLRAGFLKFAARFPELVGEIASQPKDVGFWAAALISEKIREDLLLEESKKPAPPTAAASGAEKKYNPLDFSGVSVPDLYKSAQDAITRGKAGEKASYVFNKGVAAGMALGYSLMNIAMLFVGPEEMAAKAGSLGTKGLEALKASKLWKRLAAIMEGIPELKALVGASRAATEAKAGGAVAKGAQESRALGRASKAESTGVRIVDEAPPPSVARDVVNPLEAEAEAAYIDRHPELVKGNPPRAKLGESPQAHEIVQTPEGFCVRHSTPTRVPCPASFATKTQKPSPAPPKASEQPAPSVAPGSASLSPQAERRLAELEKLRASNQAAIAAIDKQLGEESGRVGRLSGEIPNARGAERERLIREREAASAARNKLQDQRNRLQTEADRLRKEMSDLRSPPPSSPQEAGRLFEAGNVTATGMPKNQARHATSFPGPEAPDGMRIPDHMPKPDGKGGWITAATPGEAEFIADSKLLGKNVTLTQQLKGFIELASKTKQKRLLLLTDPGAVVAASVHDFARPYGVSVHLMTRSPRP